MLQYAKAKTEKFYSDDKCTKEQVIAGGPKRVDECSIRADGDLQKCWTQAQNLATGEDEYNLNNELCDRPYESCAAVYTAVEGPFYNCVLSSYCDKTGEDDLLVWGPHHSPIVGRVDCRAGARVDPNLTEDAQAKATRETE